MLPDEEHKRKARMLALMMSKKPEEEPKEGEEAMGHESPEEESPLDEGGAEDERNEMHAGISEEGRSTGSEKTCPHCGGHLDTNLAAKEGGEMHQMDTPEAEEKGKLFGHPKKHLGLLIGMK
jgi:hypothetical protein